MRILLFGKNGQVGWELSSALASLGEVISFGSNEVNFTNIDSIRDCVKRYKPNIIVNAAAYTAVDNAESNQEEAYLINSEAVRVLAEEALHINALFVHYSTDYVFDGQKELPYTEEDLPNPLSVYGKTKLQGDKFIQESGCRYLIFRISWIFCSYEKNFARTILKLAKERDVLKIVNDQIGSPTDAKLVATITSLILYRIINNNDFTNSVNEIYNLTSAGETSWHGFAFALIQQAQSLGAKLRCAPENVKAITTVEYPLPAKRPFNSTLNINKLQTTFALQLPSWELYSYRLVKELVERGFYES
ncbi:MAG: dTDP-4-dehydrorhamnose reductase [Rickettsiales bacterium]|nr:MAG: dTDP-4-dehydrorhamnose reductase [Rickettsiales bacterium]